MAGEASRSAIAGPALLAAWLALSSAPSVAGCAWAYPRDLPLVETHARFWRADIHLAAGERLEFIGTFPRARQMSFNVYQLANNQALAGLADVDIEPDNGAVNPFRPQAARNLAQRGYRVVVHRGEPVEGRNRISLPASGGPTGLRILYRIYLPDLAHPGGGVPLPAIWRVGADGGRTLLTDDCPDPAGVDPSQPVGPVRLPPGDAVARSPLEWRGSRPAGSASGDAMINRDNAYAIARTDFRLGEVLVLTGRAPTSPRTLHGESTMGVGQVRYWSLCTYRHPSDRSAACVADEPMALGSDRRFFVIVSPAARRPSEAAMRCGAVWLDALTETEGALLLRHVAPDPGFAESPLNIGAGVNAAAVLGPYEPVGRYMSRSEAEALACAAPR